MYQRGTNWNKTTFLLSYIRLSSIVLIICIVFFKVDDENLPEDFRYIHRNCEGRNMSLNRIAMVVRLQESNELQLQLQLQLQ